jgi:NTE family protein
MAKTSTKTTKVKKVKVAVACQGGGMHGAFTVGVLTEILTAYDQNKFDLVGLSGTSAGALSALMVWYGLAPKMQGARGVQAAIDQVNHAWEDFVAQPNTVETLLNRLTYCSFKAEESELPWFGISPKVFGLNPYGAGYEALMARLPSLGVRTEYFDFDAFLEDACPDFENNIVWQDVDKRLLIGASEVIRGFETVFDSHVRTQAVQANTGMDPRRGYWRQQLPLSLAGVAASGTLPVFREAQEIRQNNERFFYWDGLYSNNPPIREFFDGPKELVPDEIWIVRINPQEWPDTPETNADIQDRQNELMGNLSLHKELDLIFQRYNDDVTVRTIKMTQRRADNLMYSSKLNRSRAFMDEMRQEGRDVARVWLANWIANWPNGPAYPQDATYP